MKIRKSTIFAYVPALVMTLLLACQDDSPEQATLTFYPTIETQIDEPEAGKQGTGTTISLKTSRTLAVESKVNIRIEGNGSGYGASYITNPPSLEPGLITLTIPPGENTAAFTFTAMNDGIFAPRDYDYTLRVEEFNGAVNSLGNGNFHLKVIDSTTPFYANTFENCGTVSEQLVVGEGVSTDLVWQCKTLGSDKFIEGNAYRVSSGKCNSYLMFPVIDGALYDEVFFKMSILSYYTGAGTVSVKYSTNYSGTGNPEAEGVTWTELEEINKNIPAAGSRKWVDVSALISNVEGNLYIAVQYIGGGPNNASNWELDNIEIKGN